MRALILAVALASCFEPTPEPPTIQQCAEWEWRSEVEPAGMSVDGIRIGGVRIVQRRHCVDWREVPNPRYEGPIQ